MTDHPGTSHHSKVARLEARLHQTVDAADAVRHHHEVASDAIALARALLAERPTEPRGEWSDVELEQRLAIAFCEELHPPTRRGSDVACGRCFDDARLLMLDHRGALHAVIAAARGAERP